MERQSNRAPRLRAGALGFGLALAACLPSAHADDLDMAQRPLILGDDAVPGNLFLVPSIEWPTMNSIANIGDYSSDTSYIGYFNPQRCYTYEFDDAADEDELDSGNSDNHWAPADPAVDRECSGTGDGQWSGNFLNWAATQTIDPFRLALMGGYRHRDTPDETWLQKARHDGQGNQYPNRVISDSNVIEGATPFNASELEIEIDGLSNNSRRSPMRFWLDGSGGAEQEYDPDETGDSFGGERIADVRVSVCHDDGLMREDLCVEYDEGYKPEGLVQEFADVDNEEGTLRYSLFTYLNDSDRERDGGVLRTPKKFVGPERLDPDTGEAESNPAREWDPETGVLLDNPDDEIANATESTYGVDIERSGLVHYLGAAGQTNTNDYKSTDPVSELYYAATRYLRDRGPVEAYQELPGNTGADVEQALDDFAVAHREEDWEDPVGQFSCAPNAALTIMDVFTHRDKNLPGNRPANGFDRGDEPDYWDELEEDHDETGLDAVEATNRIGIIDESIGTNSLGESVFTGRQNSAMLAGLAYEMHTRDQRPDLPGTQTMSTYVVDVVENQALEAPQNNVAYLAAKYGGFQVPPDFDVDGREDALPEGWWSDGDIASVPDSGTTFTQPRNYYVANEARRMVESLREAFQAAASEETGSSTAVAANSTQTESDSLIFQARFDSSDWSGEILALPVDEDDGSVDTGDVAWLGSNGIPSPGSRDVFSIDDSGDGQAVSALSDLTADQQAALNNDEDLFDYLLLGEQAAEIRNGGSFRDRPRTVLGDIVNSEPFVTFGGNFGYSVLPGDEGDEYPAFLNDKEDDDDMLYVGANDGLLHAYNAEDGGGGESFAYAPDAAFDEMDRLGDPNYDHRFYVDGTVRVADAWHGSADGWKKTLVASTGAGSKTVFALDVTDAGGGGFGSGDVLWELDNEDEGGLGHVLGNIDVVRFNDGTWAAVFGNGYNSDDHEARLFIVPVDDPQNPIVLETGEGSEGDPNGLGGVSTVDLDGNGVVDVVYAGDLHGNMWRFDVESADSDSWGSDLLFEARGPTSERQPITGAPKVVPHSDPDVDMNVLFGTGQFFAEGDGTVGGDPDVNSFYAVQDDGSGDTVARSDLVEQEITGEEVAPDPPTRTLTDNAVAAGDDGWFVDLESPNFGEEGERVVETPRVIGQRVFFLSQIPESGICSFGGRSWLMEMDAESGGRTPTTLVDDDSDKGGVGFDQLASGLTVLSRGEQATFYTSLGDGSIETVDIPNPGSGRTGRQSWRQLR